MTKISYALIVVLLLLSMIACNVPVNPGSIVETTAQATQIVDTASANTDMAVDAEKVEAAETDTEAEAGQSDTLVESEAEVAAPVDDKQLEVFKAFIETARVANNIPGVAAAIVHGDTVLFANGFGVRDLQTDTPVTPNTLFHIGSTHKSITAMLLATLVDQGIVAWDEPVVSFYPNFKLSDPDATATVTLRHLLSMSSGIPADAEDEFDIESAWAVDLFDLLAETPLNGAPGEHFDYSNISASVAGYLGVLAANEDLDPYDESADTDLLYAGYANLLQQQILDPIGMKTATLSVEEAHANPDHATPHIVEESGAVRAVTSEDFTGDPLAPSGSLKASVLDMAAYLITQVKRGIAADGTRVVSEANLTQTWEPQIEDTESGGSYALGWSVYTQAGETIIAHEGSFDNFTSLLIFVPATKSGLVLLTNTDDPGNFLETVSEQFVTYTITQ